MSKREAPPSTVPPPTHDDGSGYQTDARCPLCNGSLRQGTVIWWSMPSDPDGLRRIVHAFCAHEHAKFLRAIGYVDRPATPTL